MVAWLIFFALSCTMLAFKWFLNGRSRAKKNKNTLLFVLTMSHQPLRYKKRVLKQNSDTTLREKQEWLLHKNTDNHIVLIITFVKEKSLYLFVWKGYFKAKMLFLIEERKCKVCLDTRNNVNIKAARRGNRYMVYFWYRKIFYSNI